MTVHKLLLIVVLITIGFILLECAFSNNFLISIVRSTLMVIQGTWFIHIGFILFPPWVEGQESRWNPNSHDSPMYAVVMFW